MSNSEIINSIKTLSDTLIPLNSVDAKMTIKGITKKIRDLVDKLEV